ncbi:MAG TPA: alpha/beta hydrolase [Halococcus sp.]|nr:alpha/beta hydrolase [Halococcus sp.]
MHYRGYSQAELDEQYTQSEAVSDYQGYADSYVERSNETRERLDCSLDIPFGPTIAEHLDVFPAAQSDAPILLFIHGGYWHSLSSKEFSFVANGPVSAGVTTAVLNYALCPDVTIEEIVRQSRAAVAWLHRNAEEFGGDGSRIYVAGHSAGGHLTAMVLTTDWEDDYGLSEDVISGGCAISGLFDLEPFPYTYLQPKLQLTWGEVRRTSPIRHIPESAPPLLVSYGNEETAELRRQSNDFLDAWTERGLDGEMLAQPGKNHFSAIDGFLDADSPLCRAILTRMSVTA